MSLVFIERERGSGVLEPTSCEQQTVRVLTERANMSGTAFVFRGVYDTPRYYLWVGLLPRAPLRDKDVPCHTKRKTFADFGTVS